MRGSVYGLHLETASHRIDPKALPNLFIYINAYTRTFVTRKLARSSTSFPGSGPKSAHCYHVLSETERPASRGLELPHQTRASSNTCLRTIQQEEAPSEVLAVTNSRSRTLSTWLWMSRAYVVQSTTVLVQRMCR